MSPAVPPASAWRDVTRAGLRHRTLLAAGLAAGAVATALPVLAPAPPATTGVVTATRDLLSGRPLEPGDLRLVAVPLTTVPDGAVRSLDEALGRRVAGSVRRGEALTDVRLLGAGLVRGQGMVAAPVRLADPATAALLRAGDRVDVLGVPVDGGAGQPAQTLAAGLEVLSVPRPDGDSGEGALVVLGATPETAARLASAAVTSRLSVTVLGA